MATKAMCRRHSKPSTIEPGATGLRALANTTQQLKQITGKMRRTSFQR
jgi:hypothetical protein